jgi:hypothetical protein
VNAGSPAQTAIAKPALGQFEPGFSRGFLAGKPKDINDINAEWRFGPPPATAAQAPRHCGGVEVRNGGLNW